VTPSEKDAGSGEPGTESPESPPAEQSLFQRFEEFARKVVAVSRADIEERERAYRESRNLASKSKANPKTNS